MALSASKEALVKSAQEKMFIGILSENQKQAHGMTTRSLFATRFYEGALDDAALLGELDHSCRSLAEDDRAGRNWSRAHGYRGYTSYASLDDLRAQIAPLQAVWTREAAEAYRVEQARWDRSAAALNDMLVALGNAVREGSDDVADTDRHAAGAWGF